MNAKELKTKLPRLDVQCADDYLDAVLAFAEKRGLLDQLVGKLERLANAYQRTSGAMLFKDFAPYSFEFVVRNTDGSRAFNGGLIYYGPGETGVGAPQFSVRMESDEGWSIHT